jgi:hypothetical protein
MSTDSFILNLKKKVVTMENFSNSHKLHFSIKLLCDFFFSFSTYTQTLIFAFLRCTHIFRFSRHILTQGELNYNTIMH